MDSATRSFGFGRRQDVAPGSRRVDEVDALRDEALEVPPAGGQLARAIRRHLHDDVALATLLAGLPVAERLPARLELVRQAGPERARATCALAFGGASPEFPMVPFAVARRHAPDARQRLDYSRARGVSELLMVALREARFTGSEQDRRLFLEMLDGLEAPIARAAMALLRGGDERTSYLELDERTSGAASRIAAGRGASAAAPGEGSDGAALARIAERHGASIFRREADAATPDAQHPDVEEALRRLGAGDALPSSLRTRLEAQLGVNLGDVRVHTDELAARAARALRARAFTVGEDVFFAEGAFAPDATDGFQLLLHELTHVVQGYQGRAPSTPSVSRPGDPLEREAEAVAQGARPEAAPVAEQASAPAGAILRDAPAEPAYDAAAKAEAVVRVMRQKDGTAISRAVNLINREDLAHRPALLDKIAVMLEVDELKVVAQRYWEELGSQAQAPGHGGLLVMADLVGRFPTMAGQMVDELSRDAETATVAFRVCQALPLPQRRKLLLSGDSRIAKQLEANLPRAVVESISANSYRNDDETARLLREINVPDLWKEEAKDAQGKVKPLAPQLSSKIRLLVAAGKLAQVQEMARRHNAGDQARALIDHFRERVESKAATRPGTASRAGAAASLAVDALDVIIQGLLGKIEKSIDLEDVQTAAGGAVAGARLQARTAGDDARTNTLEITLDFDTGLFAVTIPALKLASYATVGLGRVAPPGQNRAKEAEGEVDDEAQGPRKERPRADVAAAAINVGASSLKDFSVTAKWPTPRDPQSYFQLQMGALQFTDIVQSSESSLRTIGRVQVGGLKVIGKAPPWPKMPESRSDYVITVLAEAALMLPKLAALVPTLVGVPIDPFAAEKAFLAKLLEVWKVPGLVFTIDSFDVADVADSAGGPSVGSVHLEKLDVRADLKKRSDLLVEKLAAERDPARKAHLEAQRAAALAEEADLTRLEQEKLAAKAESKPALDGWLKRNGARLHELRQAVWVLAVSAGVGRMDATDVASGGNGARALHLEGLAIRAEANAGALVKNGQLSRERMNTVLGDARYEGDPEAQAGLLDGATLSAQVKSMHGEGVQAGGATVGDVKVQDLAVNVRADDGTIEIAFGPIEIAAIESGGVALEGGTIGRTRVVAKLATDRAPTTGLRVEVASVALRGLKGEGLAIGVVGLTGVELDVDEAPLPGGANPQQIADVAKQIVTGMASGAIGPIAQVAQAQVTGKVDELPRTMQTAVARATAGMKSLSRAQLKIASLTVDDLQAGGAAVGKLTVGALDVTVTQKLPTLEALTAERAGLERQLGSATLDPIARDQAQRRLEVVLKKTGALVRHQELERKSKQGPLPKGEQEELAALQRTLVVAEIDVSVGSVTATDVTVGGAKIPTVADLQEEQAALEAKVARSKDSREQAELRRQLDLARARVVDGTRYEALRQKPAATEDEKLELQRLARQLRGGTHIDTIALKGAPGEAALTLKTSFDAGATRRVDLLAAELASLAARDPKQLDAKQRAEKQHLAEELEKLRPLDAKLRDLERQKEEGQVVDAKEMAKLQKECIVPVGGGRGIGASLKLETTVENASVENVRGDGFSLRSAALKKARLGFDGEQNTATVDVGELSAKGIEAGGATIDEASVTGAHAQGQVSGGAIADGAGVAQLLGGESRARGEVKVDSATVKNVRVQSAQARLAQLRARQADRTRPLTFAEREELGDLVEKQGKVDAVDGQVAALAQRNGRIEASIAERHRVLRTLSSIPEATDRKAIEIAARDNLTRLTAELNGNQDQIKKLQQQKQGWAQETRVKSVNVTEVDLAGNLPNLSKLPKGGSTWLRPLATVRERLAELASLRAPNPEEAEERPKLERMVAAHSRLIARHAEVMAKVASRRATAEEARWLPRLAEVLGCWTGLTTEEAAPVLLPTLERLEKLVDAPPAAVELDVGGTTVDQVDVHGVKVREEAGGVRHLTVAGLKLAGIQVPLAGGQAALDDVQVKGIDVKLRIPDAGDANAAAFAEVDAKIEVNGFHFDMVSVDKSGKASPTHVVAEKLVVGSLHLRADATRPPGLADGAEKELFTKHLDSARVDLGSVALQGVKVNGGVSVPRISVGTFSFAADLKQGKIALELSEVAASRGAQLGSLDLGPMTDSGLRLAISGPLVGPLLRSQLGGDKTAGAVDAEQALASSSITGSGKLHIKAAHLAVAGAHVTAAGIDATATIVVNPPTADRPATATVDADVKIPDVVVSGTTPGVESSLIHGHVRVDVIGDQLRPGEAGGLDALTRCFTTGIKAVNASANAAAENVLIHSGEGLLDEAIRQSGLDGAIGIHASIAVDLTQGLVPIKSADFGINVGEYAFEAEASVNPTLDALLADLLAAGKKRVEQAAALLGRAAAAAKQGLADGARLAQQGANALRTAGKTLDAVRNLPIRSPLPSAGEG